MENSEKEKASILANLPTCALFMYLYFFQGLSFGLAKIVGFSLRANGVSYEQMAVYTLIGLPFAIKILYSVSSLKNSKKFENILLCLQIFYSSLN
jgi:hypothetical protein